MGAEGAVERAIEYLAFERETCPDGGIVAELESIIAGLRSLVGPGTAGARDETARKAAAFDKVACHNCRGYGRTGRPGSPPDWAVCISCGGAGVKGPALLDRFPLDAPRAGGAGDKEAADGGAGGG